MLHRFLKHLEAEGVLFLDVTYLTLKIYKPRSSLEISYSRDAKRTIRTSL
jgi:hypothetical protein